MPTGGPGVPQKLTPPQTRVTNQWGNFWKTLAVNNPRKTSTARMYSTHLRQRTARR